jgi:hypothetical protein
MRQVIIMIVFLFGSPVWALTFMGSPSSNVQQGEFFLGFDYSHGEVDFEFRGDGIRDTLRHVDNDHYLGRVGIGIFDGFEVFGRFGVGKLEDLSNEFAWGLGTKTTFIKKDNISWGALFQFTALQADETDAIGDYFLDGDLMSMSTSLP